MRDEIRERIEAIRRGEVPEGYKRLEGYTVPIEWEAVPFNSLFERSTRKNDTGCENVLTISAQMGLVSQREYYEKDIASEDKSGYFLLKNGDYAYNKSYSTGYPYGAIKQLVDYDEGIVSPLYICFTPKAGTNTSFYSQYFEGGMYNREIYRFAQEGARNHGLLNIPVEDFFTGALIVPSKVEQRRIAEVLDACDRVIRLKQELIKEKQEQKRWVMNSLLNPTSEAYKADSVDCKWVSRRIKEIGTVVTGSTPSRKEPAFWDGKFAWITAQDFLGKFITDSVEHLSEEGKEQCRVLPPDTLLVTCIASIGLNAITRIPCATNQQINAVICNDSCLVEMLYYVIEYNKEVIKRIAGKTAVPIISKEQFENLKIALPDSIDEQRRIVNVLACIDDSIEKTIKECDYWQQKKKALMQLLLTGLVRVNA